MIPANIDLLRDGLSALGLELSPARFDALVDYHDFLLETCDAGLNLTGIRDERESVIRNLLDSLAPWRQLLDGADAGELAIAEVGAGGGLPGVPLLLALPWREVVLIESKEKKCAFLRDALARRASVYAPTSATVIRADVRETRRRFDRLLFRAFASLAEIAKLAPRLLASNGVAVCWKGKRDRIDAELSDVPSRVRDSATIIEIAVPQLPPDEERHVVLLRA